MEIKRFINLQNIPKNQPVIIVGDMNVDMLSEKGKKLDQYTDMLRLLNATFPKPTGHGFTLDRNTNEWVDPDDGPPQWLDYALISNDHQKPKKASVRGMCFKSTGEKTGTKCKKGTEKSGVRDLSDHYPILYVGEY